MIFICKNFKKYEDFILVTCQSLSNNINLIQYSILVFKLTNGIPIYLKKINNILNDSNLDKSILHSFSLLNNKNISHHKDETQYESNNIIIRKNKNFVDTLISYYKYDTIFNGALLTI